MSLQKLPTAPSNVGASPSPQCKPRHCEQETYAHFLKSWGFSFGHRLKRLRCRRCFVERWPDLEDWFHAPLPERVGRCHGESQHSLTCQVSYDARSYILFLALSGYVCLDYQWLLAIDHLHVRDHAKRLGIDFGLDQLTREAINLGFNPIHALPASRWSVCRIALHRGRFDVSELRKEHTDELLQAIRAFGHRPDLNSYFASTESFRPLCRCSWIPHVHLLQVVLYHRGQTAALPRLGMPRGAESALPLPAMQAVVERWLKQRALTNRPNTILGFKVALRRFLNWIAEADPTISSFADVTRDHLLAYLEALATEPTPSTGQPLAPSSRRDRISILSVFFRDTTAWGWEEVPARPSLIASDLPKVPRPMPRFIPAHELARLMAVVAELKCPYQRAAILVARWSGARLNEIRRLSTDCLDSYPDGTPRLRLPAGKTYRERLVPIHKDAADALREVIADRAGRKERTLVDDLTHRPTQYLFMKRGRLIGKGHLFYTPLKRACKAAGLVDTAGRPLVHPHRFRHTVGTQLAERGAKLHTIMSVLGHRSVSMSLVYAQISDPEVLRDYQAVFGSGAVLAGPAAEGLRNGTLPTTAIDWLKCNFFKTELELGRCLRLPAEGPCECDLYLNCAKFVTTRAYAPRLRERLKVERTLAEDAETRGWPREQERHIATATRLEQLLTDLGEPPEDSTDCAWANGPPRE